MLERKIEVEGLIHSISHLVLFSPLCLLGPLSFLLPLNVDGLYKLHANRGKQPNINPPPCCVSGTRSTLASMGLRQIIYVDFG